MFDLIANAPVDAALLVLTAIYLFVSWRLLASVNRRDDGVHRMREWAERFESSARARASATPAE